MKRNKIRYKSKPINKILIHLTGKVFLQYVDDEEALQAKKGDLLAYPQNEALHTTRCGDYEGTGFSGYFKLDVHDGKDWKPLIVTDVFKEGENHFSKKERPIDTYVLCEALLREMTGRAVMRTYREHYTPDDEEG